MRRRTSAAQLSPSSQATDEASTIAGLGDGSTGAAAGSGGHTEIAAAEAAGVVAGGRLGDAGSTIRVSPGRSSIAWRVGTGLPEAEARHCRDRNRLMSSTAGKPCCIASRSVCREALRLLLSSNGPPAFTNFIAFVAFPVDNLLMIGNTLGCLGGWGGPANESAGMVFSAPCPGTTGTRTPRETLKIALVHVSAGPRYSLSTVSSPQQHLSGFDPDIRVDAYPRTPLAVLPPERCSRVPGVARATRIPTRYPLFLLTSPLDEHRDDYPSVRTPPGARRAAPPPPSRPGREVAPPRR